MARSKLRDTSEDLVSDGGAVLWSLITGEQLEFPLLLNFLEAAQGYTYECKILEAANLDGQTDKPYVIRTPINATTITVRVPTYRGSWSAGTSYNQGDVVLYTDGLYYHLDGGGINRVSATIPPDDPLFTETTLNTVYIQIPSTLGDNWTVVAQVNYAVYGFIELSVTEPTGVLYQRTWKPVRGMVQLLYSPTQVS